MHAERLRIHFSQCSESLDLLGNEEELHKVVAWVLMMNRLGDVAGEDAVTIAGDAIDASLHVDIACAGSPGDEKNARNAVADLLGLFDPAEHRVLRHVEGEHDHADMPMVLWPQTTGPSQRFAQAGGGV